MLTALWVFIGLAVTAYIAGILSAIDEPFHWPKPDPFASERIRAPEPKPSEPKRLPLP